MQNISPKELKSLLDQNEKQCIILDVREKEELQIAQIGGIHIPLGELSTRFQELDSNAWIVTLCHHGMRSAMAAGFLREQGFSKVTNLSGGIERWSAEVDPKIPRY